MDTKKIIFWLHKQAGIWLALFFIILGLTGSILVFMHDLEPVIHTDLLKPDRPTDAFERTNLDTAIATFNARKLHDHRVLRIYPPAIKNNVYRIVTSRVDPESRKFKGDFFFHYISPYNAEYLGKHLVKTHNRFRWSMPIMRLLVQIHAQLMVGGYGILFIGLVGIAFFVTTLIGFYLWLPKNWSKAFSISWKSNLTRVMFDLHKQIGFWAGLVLLLITSTGIYHAFPDEVIAIVKKVLPYENTSTFTKQQVIDLPINIQAYADYVSHVYPDGKNMRVHLQNLEKDRITVTISQPKEINVYEGKTYLEFEYSSGYLIKHQEPKTTPLGRRLINWMLPLHNGEAFGLLGKILFSIIGLMPLVLFVTGFYVFYKKYQAKNKKGLLNFVIAVLSPK